MAVDSILLVLPAALLITLVGVYTIGTGSAAVNQPDQTNMGRSTVPPHPTQDPVASSNHTTNRSEGPIVIHNATHDICIGNCTNTSSTAH